MTRTTGPQPARHSHRPAHPAARGGFTIIELLMVVVIIGILAAMLIPAISGARRAAREAEVITEIQNFTAAIAQFKERYGTEPPSFIVLYEQGEFVGSGQDWGSDTSSGLPDEYRRTSRATIRQIWPDFDFSALGDPASNTNTWPGNPIAGNNSIDLNDNGTETDVLILNGAECLVFFLGGVLERADTDGDGMDDSWRNSGFAANPRWPFLGLTAADNRVGPFFEFDPGRLIDIDSVRGIDTVEAMPEYLDALPSQQLPYQYLSSYDGRGYQQWGRDNMQATQQDNELMPFSVGLFMHYLTEPPGSSTSLNAHKPNSFQIISPGLDGEFGLGGFYDGESVPSTEDLNGNGMLDPGEDINGNGMIDSRDVERDNLTNLKRGPLN